MSAPTFQCTMTVKSGLEVIGTLEGKEVSTRNITIADLQKILEVEAWLEKLFGYRFWLDIDLGPEAAITFRTQAVKKD